MKNFLACRTCFPFALRRFPLRRVTASAIALSGAVAFAAASPTSEQALRVKVDPATGVYAIGAADSASYALTAGVGVEVNGQWLRAADYPHCAVSHAETQGELGKAAEWTVVYSGKTDAPELVYHLRAYAGQPFGEIQVSVRNTTKAAIHVEGLRSVDASAGAVVDLGGAAADDRVLSDSWSEDRPGMTIHDLADAKAGMHRAVGSQLIYNQSSHQSLFLGALSSDRFLTVLRLKLAASSGKDERLASYEVDSTGTTELQLENALEHSPSEDRVTLSLPVEPGAELSSERVLFSVSTDYHRQLTTYGSLIRTLHHARVSAPPLMGWWSWTAYYFGLNDGAAATNAQWEAQHLKSLGYNVFHIDEGYQYARGEYSTPNATLFPDGLIPVYRNVQSLGLTPGIWTAPFEVSERAWVYQNHPEWLVKNAAGKPIHAGFVDTDKNQDQLYMLDTTNPEAQAYLRKTYSTLTKVWGVRYIKLDFMDDSTIEGYHYKPGTTALEAQRIGLKVIRDAVGEDVYLDKDGSPMLNPVGLVDYGRISQDTGHSFDASKEAVTGIAARYYMNRNFFVADPDAFAVSEQTIPDQVWHESSDPASLDVARVAISLAAVSGGMFEIGDNLPSLSNDPERLALIENPDLMNMVKIGKASIPLDLMTFPAEQGRPGVFYLKEDSRQSILTVFNWSDAAQDRTVDLATAGLPAGRAYTLTDVLDAKRQPALQGESLALHLAPHSVAVIRIVDTQAPAPQLKIAVEHPGEARTGDSIAFSAKGSEDEPVLSWRWDFGDGVTLEAAHVQHAYTEPGEYAVHLTATGLNGATAEEHFKVRVSGHMRTTFDPKSFQRYTPAN
ncbi:PKD domain-containing protein [Silvibacterium sp.]|uniref:PKD domain-containing protein n=1 Tax=Silvibacterium sp. TaxID=1964179 RepID=UPI0039E6B873